MLYILIMNIMKETKSMSYDHKISDLKYRINGLVPKNVCQKIINIFEKYPEFHFTEESYKHKNANGFIPLVGNSVVIVKAPLEHKVTPVMKPTVPRKTIQIFINNGKNNGKNS